MSTSGDWLPRPRAAQIEMARRWKPLVAVQQTAWNIAPADVARLEAAILSVDAAQASFDNSATPGNRAALWEAFRSLATAMRWFKRRVFLTPPLDSRDYADLGLRPPDACSKALRAFELGVCDKRKLHTYIPGVLRSKTPKLTGAAG